MNDQIRMCSGRCKPRKQEVAGYTPAIIEFLGDYENRYDVSLSDFISDQMTLSCKANLLGQVGPTKFDS